MFKHEIIWEKGTNRSCFLGAVAVLPKYYQHNAHMHSLILDSFETRINFIEELYEKWVNVVFHYVPLHDSPAGSHYGRVSDELLVTEAVANKVIRLPLWIGMEKYQAAIIQNIDQFTQGITKVFL